MGDFWVIFLDFLDFFALRLKILMWDDAGSVIVNICDTFHVQKRHIWGIFLIFSEKIKASEIFLSDSLTLKIYNSLTAGPTMSNFFLELPEEAYFKPKW